METPISNANLRYGLRLIVDSSGIGRQISLVPIVIQLGSCYLATCYFPMEILTFMSCWPKSTGFWVSLPRGGFYGEKASFKNAPGLALVQIASMAADFLMVRMYDKDRRDAYYRCKACDENLFGAHRNFHRA